jgi:hypothetical protein
MKKNVIKIVILILILIGVYYLCVIFNIGPIGYQWELCENGMYTKYPKNYIDANSTYHDSNGNNLGSCGFWNSTDENCLNIRKQSGQCKNSNFLEIMIKNKLGL